MATEQFIHKSFTPESRRIINKAEEILRRYKAQNITITLRQLYYQFVGIDFFPNSEKSYKQLGSIISDARLAGEIDWAAIADLGREQHDNSHWETPGDILESAAYGFRLDSWEGQANWVGVMVEKQALESVLLPLCRNLDITFIANKGYSSSSAMYEIGTRLRSVFVGGGDLSDYGEIDELALSFACDDDEPCEGVGEGFYIHSSEAELSDEIDAFSEAHSKAWTAYQKDWKTLDHLQGVRAVAAENLVRPLMKPHPDGGKQPHIIYLGDHDPSGIDMTRDVRERLEMFSRCPVKVHRIALNMDQVRRYSLPENPAKLSDSRAEEYVKQFGPHSWELDALEPRVLQTLVQGIVESLCDTTRRDVVIAQQETWKTELRELAAKYKEATNANT